MHDPMVVLFEIKLPIPQFAWKATSHEPRWGVRAYRRTNPENLGEFVYGWWKPKSWRVFAFGRRIRWWGIATVWHVEPRGHNSGEVCGRHPHGWRLPWWTVRHVRHLNLQVHSWQAFKRWAWQRCAHCGGRSRRWMPVNVSHQWDGERQKAFKSAPYLYHSHCSSLVHYTRKVERALKALADLDVTKEQLIDKGWDWTAAWNVEYDIKQTQEARRG